MSVDFFQPRRRRRTNGALFAFQPDEVTTTMRGSAIKNGAQRSAIRNFVVVGAGAKSRQTSARVVGFDQTFGEKIKRLLFVQRHRLLSYSTLLVLSCVLLGLTYTSIRFLISRPRRLPEFPSMPVGSKPDILGEKITLRGGESLAGALSRVVNDPGGVNNAVSIFSDFLNLRHLASGQTFDVGYSIIDGRKKLKSVILSRGRVDRIAVLSDPTGRFYGQHSKNFLSTQEVEISGAIESSLYADGLAAGAPVNKLAQLFDVFAFTVDFQRDLHPGDKFHLFYETENDSLGRVASVGNLKAARLTAAGKEYLAFQYRDAQGKINFYSQDGRGIRKALLLMPVNGGRLTSGYGARRNPVYGYTEVHPALDFAAPIGTPIMAAGDGKIIHRGWDPNGYGNYLKIQHSNGYVTLYAHMSGFARSSVNGARVLQGQTIGYVGSTGMSTGPHLHYEVHIGKKKTNPATVVRAMDSSRNLSGKEVEEFKAQIAPYLLKLRGESTQDIDKNS
ncbi:MAG: M23 family metallopeptidase [Spirochaetia bacterium]